MEILRRIVSSLRGSGAVAGTPTGQEADSVPVGSRAAIDRLILRGHQLFDQGDVPAALEAYRAALDATPPDDSGVFKLHVSLGNCHEVMGHTSIAIVGYRAALACDPRCAPAHFNLARLLRLSGDLQGAAQHEAAFALLDVSPALRLRQALQVPALFSDSNAVDIWRANWLGTLHDIAALPSAAIDHPELDLNGTGLYLAYHGRNNRLLMETLCRTVRCHYAASTSLAAALPLHPRTQRIRIGFVSAFFHNHSIGRLYRGLLEALDRQRFELWVFSIGHQDDETAQRIAANADHFCALPERVTPALETVRAVALDVLYFPEIGLHPVPYFMAYSRLAPVQCMSYGHPDTSGIDTVDYFLSAAALESPGSAVQYSERMVALPGFFMPAYEQPDYPVLPKSHADFQVPTGAHVYFCPQTLIKFHSDFDIMLAAILRRDTTGFLVLIDTGVPEWKTALQLRFAATLPDAGARVRFLPRQSTVDYVNLLRAAGAVLDTRHFGGGISVMDAFAAGVPLVTLAGDHFRGRQAAACYREMGLDDYVSLSVGEYVERAVQLASDPVLRARESARVLEHNHRLFNRHDAVRALENFLEDAVRVARSGNGSNHMPGSRLYEGV